MQKKRNFPFHNAFYGVILMRRISLFVEDFGQENVLKTLVERFAEEYSVEVRVYTASVRGGVGKMLTELKEYLRDLKRSQDAFSDLLIIGRDANCKGYVTRRNELEQNLTSYDGLVLYAIPDPHIERWLLLDSAAFKSVLGKGCSAPDKKCDRDRYKTTLLNEVRKTGLIPLAGGMEHAEKIMRAMDVTRMIQTDDSFGRFLHDLQDTFKEWSRLDKSGEG